MYNITRDDLHNHYKMYYGPHNAVLVIVGDIRVDQVQEQIDKFFGSIPTGPSPLPVMLREPTQQSERRVVRRQPGQTAYFQAVYHACEGIHTDAFTLLMLESILSGASFGGPSTHRSARLYQALVETNIATNSSASYQPSIDPGTFNFSGTVRHGHTLTEFEAALDVEIERLKEELVSPTELEKVLKQTRAQLSYAMERVSNQARWLGWLEMLGGWQHLDTLISNLAAVTSEDIRQAAQKYLRSSNRTVGWFEPT